jgi:hypothetical protein
MEGESKISVFWDVMLCSLIDVMTFWVNVLPPSYTLKMELVRPSKN